MAGSYEFDIAWDGFISQVESFVQDKVQELEKDISSEIAKAIQAGAKNKLINRATPKDSTSSSLLLDVSDNILVSEDDYGHYVTVGQDDEGLALFLEYGTGLVGREDPHPDASNVGWNYAVNEQDYTIARESQYNKWKRGFRFKRFNNYLDVNDVNPIYYHSTKTVKPNVYVSKTKPHTDKRGRLISGYERVITRRGGFYEYHQYYPQWALSQGLKPLRYMYDTKMQVSRLINRHKNKPDGYKALKRSLSNYIRRNT